MKTKLGRFASQFERPEPLKFAWPVVLLPDLFSTPRHLEVLVGYLSTIGWEVYAPDLRPAAAGRRTRELANRTFSELLSLAHEALDALGREAIVLGHGMGGLLALKAAERRSVKAAVAFAPLVPGFRTPLLTGLRNRLSVWMGRPLSPPSGRVLFELVSELEPFQRERAIKSLVPDTARAALEVARAQVEFRADLRPAPRLIVAGDSDLLAPINYTARLADALGAVLVKLPGRGHWIIGGRAVEHAVGASQRFLVRTLGQDLLLLYPEQDQGDCDGAA